LAKVLGEMQWAAGQISFSIGRSNDSSAGRRSRGFPVIRAMRRRAERRSRLSSSAQSGRVHPGRDGRGHRRWRIGQGSRRSSRGLAAHAEPRRRDLHRVAGPSSDGASRRSRQGRGRCDGPERPRLGACCAIRCSGVAPFLDDRAESWVVCFATQFPRGRSVETRRCARGASSGVGRWHCEWPMTIGRRANPADWELNAICSHAESVQAISA